MEVVDPIATTGDFEAFYAAEYPGQLRRAFLMLGNTSDAQEVVADSFTALFERWGSVSESGPYLNRVVLNRCRDIGRRRSRVERLPLPVDITEAEGLAQVEMADLLLTLPHKQRAVVVLRYYEGRTENDIADALGIKQGSVGPTLHRALAKLKGALS